MTAVMGSSRGISSRSYSDVQGGYIHNGIWQASLRWWEFPLVMKISTFVDAGNAGGPLRICLAGIGVEVPFRPVSSRRKEAVHQMIREEYGKRHERAVYKNSLRKRQPRWWMRYPSESE